MSDETKKETILHIRITRLMFVALGVRSKIDGMKHSDVVRKLISAYVGGDIGINVGPVESEPAEQALLQDALK